MGQFVEGATGFFGEGHEGSDDMVGFAEGDSFLDEVIDNVSGEEHGIGDGGGARFGDGFDAGQASGEDV